MKLQEAIKMVIALKSTNILNNVLVINILNDYNAFEDISSSKNVFKNISIHTTVSVKYKIYYTNGIQEYITSEKTVLLQPIKGLK